MSRFPLLLLVSLAVLTCGCNQHSSETSNRDTVEAQPNRSTEARVSGITDGAGEVIFQWYTGRLYVEGSEVPKDFTKAEALLEKAANAGHMLACHTLGVIYYAGLAGTQDRIKARNYFQLGAEAGDTSALYNYGVMCLKGEDGEKNIVEAIKTLYLAAAKENVKARKVMQEIQSSVTANDWAMGKQLAETWKPRPRIPKAYVDRLATLTTAWHAQKRKLASLVPEDPWFAETLAEVKFQEAAMTCWDDELKFHFGFVSQRREAWQNAAKNWISELNGAVDSQTRQTIMTRQMEDEYPQLEEKYGPSPTEGSLFARNGTNPISFTGFSVVGRIIPAPFSQYLEHTKEFHFERRAKDGKDSVSALQQERADLMWKIKAQEEERRIMQSMLDWAKRETTK